MEWDSIKWFVLGGGLLLLAFLWLIWKFFFKLLKHFVIILILGGIFAGVSWYRNQPPPKNPAIGKHAYLTESGKYLGVVEGEGDDPRRGAVWVTRFPGGHPLMYGKSRVTLKDKRDLASEPTPEPTATPTPAAKTKSAPTKK
ncbi:MAG: hypothetical protein SF097_11110 [Acidobacteriota bacterium]|nr:hypothetical protein [Acidobacteriota bacterium]